MQLEFDKKLAAIQQKHDEDLKNMRQGANQAEMEASLKSLAEKQKASMQSWFDKQMAKLQVAKSKAA